MTKLLVLFASIFVFASTAAAREGSVDLTSNAVSCKGISLYQDGNYRVSGRCDGLVYPYETTFNKYVLWGKTITRGELIRIGEVDRGYFSGFVASPFDGMIITAESDGLVRRPSDRQVVAGAVTPFDFDKSQVTATPAPTTAPASGNGNTSTTVQGAKSTAGAVVGKILSSLLVIVLVIVGLVIGASLLFRSRGSVSA